MSKLNIYDLSFVCSKYLNVQIICQEATRMQNSVTVKKHTTQIIKNNIIIKITRSPMSLEIIITNRLIVNIH